MSDIAAPVSSEAASDPTDSPAEGEGQHTEPRHTHAQLDARAVRSRRYILFYDILVLSALVTLAILYFNTDAISDVLPNQLRGLPAYTAWFGVLGSVAISFKGISDYAPTADRWGGKWPLWYVARPFSGLVVGIVTYTLLRAVYTSGKPTAPTFEAAAFVLGTQEARFFAFLTAIAKVVLHIPGDDASGGGGSKGIGGSNSQQSDKTK